MLDSGGSGEIPVPTVKVWMGEENGNSHAGISLRGPLYFLSSAPLNGGRL